MALVSRLHIDQFSHLEPFRKFVLAFGELDDRRLIEQLQFWFKSEEIRIFFEYDILQREEIVSDQKSVVHGFVKLPLKKKTEAALEILRSLIKDMSTDKFMSLTVAAERWHLSDSSVLRKALLANRFCPVDVKRVGSAWYVTEHAMERLYGPALDKGVCINDRTRGS